MCMVGPRALVVFKLFSLGWLSLQVTKTHPAVLTTCTTFCETINYDFRLNPNDWSLQTGTLSNVNWKCSIACGRLQALGKSCLGAGRRGIGAVHLGLCAFAQFLKEHGSLNFLVTSIQIYTVFSVCTLQISIVCELITTLLQHSADLATRGARLATPCTLLCDTLLSWFLLVRWSETYPVDSQ